MEGVQIEDKRVPRCLAQHHPSHTFFHGGASPYGLLPSPFWHLWKAKLPVGSLVRAAQVDFSKPQRSESEGARSGFHGREDFTTAGW